MFRKLDRCYWFFIFFLFLPLISTMVHNFNSVFIVEKSVWHLVQINSEIWIETCCRKTIALIRLHKFHVVEETFQGLHLNSECMSKFQWSNLLRLICLFLFKRVEIFAKAWLGNIFRNEVRLALGNNFIVPIHYNFFINVLEGFHLEKLVVCSYNGLQLHA